MVIDVEGYVSEFDATEIGLGEVRHGVYELVGHGRAMEKCGKHAKTLGCLHTELHGGARFTKDGVLEDHTGEIYVKRVKINCGRPSCPVCYQGWANKEAGKIEHRLVEASKVLPKGNAKSAQVEHVIVSIPPSMYGIDERKLRRFVGDGLKARGVYGYCLFFHAFRYANEEEAFEKDCERGWRYSPHYHVLGFVRGGYECRGCKKVCEAHNCNGFEARTRLLGKKDKLIVKIARDRFGEASERRSLWATARYELGHCTIRSDSKRAHAVTWAGSVSYHRLKVPPMIKTRGKCPLCAEELQRIWYTGVSFIGKDRFWAKLVQDGVEVAGLLPEKQFLRSGGYVNQDLGE